MAIKLRTCRWLHECAHCGQNITDGQLYYDGGYGRRTHEECGYPDPIKMCATESGHAQVKGRKLCKCGHAMFTGD